MHIIPLLILASLALPELAVGAEPSTAESTPPAVDMAAYVRGAKAWADNCARCHNMRDPKSLNDAQWHISTTHMRLRAGLDGSVTRDITLFLQGSN